MQELWDGEYSIILKFAAMIVIAIVLTEYFKKK